MVFIKGISVSVVDYRSKEREIHDLLVGQDGYNSEFYCGANGIDIMTKDNMAIIPCIEKFESFLNSKGIIFENLEVELIVNEI